jgi:hypothetical protein
LPFSAKTAESVDFPEPGSPRKMIKEGLFTILDPISTNIVNLFEISMSALNALLAQSPDVYNRNKLCSAGNKKLVIKLSAPGLQKQPFGECRAFELR